MTEESRAVFEVAPREVIGAPVRRWWPAHWKALVLLLPAAVTAVAGLAAPFGSTVVTSLTAGGGPGNYSAVLSDPAIVHAVIDSVILVLFALLVCMAGLAVAWAARRARRTWRVAVVVLAAPLAVSAFAMGVAFRLLSAPWPVALGPGGIWAVLLLAFAWQWAGLAVVVFRVGLADVPADLLRTARAFGAGPLRRAQAVVVPALFPVGALMAIIVLVAAARVFELVLATAPGSVQDRADVVGVHFWRFQAQLGNGKSAALAVLLSLFVAAVALVGLWGLGREWPAGQAAPAPATQTGTGSGMGATGGPGPTGETLGRGMRVRRWSGRTMTVAAMVVWMMPLVVLTLTSLHDPVPAATGRWWAGGWGLGSYRAAFADGQLLPAIVNTAARAVSAGLVLTLLAVPAAYALAWGGLPRAISRGIVAVAAVLAVIPPQGVVIPLSAGLDQFRLFGAAVPLTGVYVALGLPLAVLLLRGAFASVPRREVRAWQFGPGQGAALLAVAARCAPALVTVAVFGFVLVWNDLLIGLLFGGTEAGQATLVLFEQTRQFSMYTGQLAAGAVLITLVPLALVLGCGKWLVRGLAEGTRR